MTEYRTHYRSRIIAWTWLFLFSAYADSLSIRLSEANGHKPLSGVPVEIISEGRKSTTNTEGELALPRPDRPLHMRVSLGGYSPLELRFEDSTARVLPSSIDLALFKLGRICGKVLDTKDRPIAGATVFAIGDKGARLVSRSRTDDLGEYCLADILAGEYAVAARIPTPLGVGRLVWHQGGQFRRTQPIAVSKGEVLPGSWWPVFRRDLRRRRRVIGA